MLAREWLCGTFLNLGSPITVEIAGLAGFDWILIDHEHGPGGQDTLLHQLHAASATPAVPIVRIAANETPRFKRVLDMGALGVMVPWVSTVAEATSAVSAMRYPPHGIRGVAKFNRGAGFGGDFEEYYAHANERLLTVIQIETPEAVANIDAIAEPGALHTTEQLVEGRDELRRILDSVEELPDDRREALIMRFALGMNNKEIGHALGRSEGATKVLLHRAIKQLETLVGEPQEA